MPGIIDQIQSEYIDGYNFLRSRKSRWVAQLVLLNNLQRGDENIASSMYFTFFNRVLGGLYDDKMQIKFLPSEDSDAKKAEALNKLSIHDYREMEKDLLDHDWLWDTCFFGRGYMETIRFDKKRKLMVPQVINPLTMVYDPYFEDPRDWRYYGKWITVSYHKLTRLIRLGLVTGIKSSKEIAGGMESDIWEYKVRREAAKVGVASSGTTQRGNVALSPESAGNNAIYQILEFYTHDEEGRKCVYWLDKNFSKILRKDYLDNQDAEEDVPIWPLVHKDLFRESHSSLPISVPDIIEDKHRALNVLYNLSYLAAKDEANPIYEYDVNKVKDVTQLFQRQVKQHIPVEEIGAIQPLNKSQSLTQSLLQFIGLLKTESSDAIGTTYVMPQLQKKKQSATESALMQQIADLTQSLQSKILGIGEKEFWSQWYERYLENLSEGDEKIISISTVNAVTFENITLENIKTKYPPKIMVFSAKEAQYKELVDRRDLGQLFPVLAQNLDPHGMKNFLKHVFLPKFKWDSSTIDSIVPKTIDEIKAEQENELLNINETAVIDASDDDETHMYLHLQAKNTQAKWAHYLGHQVQYALKKKQMELQQQQSGQQEPQTPQESLKSGKKKKGTPISEGAVPLMEAVTSSAKGLNKNKSI